MHNETIRTIRSRRSTRGFNKKAIPKDIIEELLDCARMAPSAMNRQPWKFIVITDKKLIKEMSERIKHKAIERFPHVKDRAESMDDPIFYGSGLLIMILRPKNDEWAGFDCSAAAENMMLAARSLEIGSVPIGFAKFIDSDKQIMAKLGIQDDHEQHITIALGYVDEWPEAPERNKDDAVWI